MLQAIVTVIETVETRAYPRALDITGPGVLRDAIEKTRTAVTMACVRNTNGGLDFRPQFKVNESPELATYGRSLIEAMKYGEDRLGYFKPYERHEVYHKMKFTENNSVGANDFMTKVRKKGQ